MLLSFEGLAQINFPALSGRNGNLVPVLANTTAASSITSTSASSGGNVFSDRGSALTSEGVCWSTSQNPTIADSKSSDGLAMGAFTSNIIGLTSGTKYYVRAYATNIAGAGYGSQVSFTTLSVPVVAPTTEATTLSNSSASSGGNITSDGGAIVTTRGIVWSTSPNPDISSALGITTNGAGTGTFTSSITGLTTYTTYYVRSYATNNIGTGYGTQVSFTIYTCVSIGSQCWMEKNLDVTTYRDGTPITQVDDNYAWSLGNAAWCYYDKDPANGAIYGKLYNWYAVDDPRKLAPKGWHIPTDADWTTLADFLGGNAAAGGKMKSTGTTLWNSPNSDATNSSGFTALPGGARLYDGGFASIGIDGFWWSATDWYGSNSALSRYLVYWNSYLNRDWMNSDKRVGFSVRCILDVIPVLTSTAVTSIRTSSASSGGKILNAGGLAITAEGVCWSTSENPTIANSKTSNGTADGAFTSSITGLTANTTYYLRAYATNSLGTGYGAQVTFTNTKSLPVLAATSASSVTASSAIIGGNITSDGADVITTSGVCWGTSPNPDISLSTKTTDGSGIGSFTSSISGLTAGTTYYVRSYATNSLGTGYGDQISFNSDIAVIGSQYWMKKNLEVTTYRDGTPIPEVKDAATFAALTTGAWCYYNNDPANGAIYGKLYNWYAVAGIWNEASKTDASVRKQLAPTAWHVPTDEEWTTLTTYLGEAGAGSKMKATGDIWIGGNEAATNESGFTGLPGGYFNYSGRFSDLGNDAYWWTATEYTYWGTPVAWYRDLYNGSDNLLRNNFYKTIGFSVRCLSGDIPVLAATTAATTITSTSASSGGNVTSNGGAAITAEGICWSTTSNPTTANSKASNGTAMGAFTSSITGLTPGNTYYIRSYATNSVGTGYGDQVSFTTLSVPVLATTTAATSIAIDEAISGGNITSDGGASVTLRGVVWSPYSSPTLESYPAGGFTWSGSGTGDFTSNITGLTPGTTFYVRSYATNSIGTGYGEQIIFTTLPDVPILSFPWDGTNIWNITKTSALSRYYVETNSGADITNQGLCWSTSPNPTTADSHTSSDLSGIGAHYNEPSCILTGLTPATTYYVRAYATNSVGTGYGSQVSFTTLP